MTDMRTAEPKPKQQRITAGIRRLHLLIAALGLVLIGIAGYGFYAGDRISTVDAALLRAVMKIKLEAATTNLVMEGLLGDGLATDFEPVWAPLDAAVREFRSAVQESRQRLDVLPFRTVAVGAADLENLERHLAAFKEKAAQRFADRRISLLDREPDRVYRQAFRKLAGNLDALEDRLRNLISVNLARFRYSQAAMIALCGVLTGLATFLFQRYSGRLASAYAALQTANEGLENEISERRRSEARREQLVRELKDFSNAVSHDLRAPLINLKGFTREIESAHEAIRPKIEEILAASDENGKQAVAEAFYQDLPEAVEYIKTAVAGMERLTGAVLKLARLERRELLLEPLDMKAVVQDTLKALGHQIKVRGVHIVVGELPETAADRVAMEQIFSNLIGNAINYLVPGRAGEIEIGGEARPDENTYFVRDNGRGIKSGDVDKAFNLFERLGTDSVPGEGMGLAYVRALVRRHGGIVFCESQVGVGSKFTFSISKRIL